MCSSDLKVNLIGPVATRSRLRAEAMPGEDPQSLPHPDDLTDAFVELASPDCTHNGEIVPAPMVVKSTSLET